MKIVNINGSQPITLQLLVDHLSQPKMAVLRQNPDSLGQKHFIEDLFGKTSVKEWIFRDILFHFFEHFFNEKAFKLFGRFVYLEPVLIFTGMRQNLASGGDTAQLIGGDLRV